jgi:hypothetical protein
MGSLPRLLRLRRATLARSDALGALVARSLRLRSEDLARATHAFAFKCDELWFARRVLSEHPRFWLYRSNQAAACGDFVVVDLSAPDPRRRRVWIVDLKLGAALRRGGGPAGWQLRCAAAAVDELVARGVVAEPSFSLWSGDSAAVLTALGDG